MRRSIVIILLLISCIGYAQQPFYGDRKFVSYDGVDTLYLNHTGTFTEWLFTSPLKWGENLQWDDGTLYITDGFNNIFIGALSGLNREATASNNTGLGITALKEILTGDFNTGLGSNALRNNNGSYSTSVGYRSLTANTTGQHNTSMGSASLSTSVSGSNNVALGYEAGNTNLGSSNVFLGYKSGYNETGSNTLYIENNSSASDTAFIFGDFAADTLNLNAKTSSKYYLGDLYIDGDSVTAVLNGVVQTIKNWNAAGEAISENTTLTDSSITAAVDGNGYYSLGWDLSFTYSVNNTLCHFALYVNDVLISKSQAHRRIATGGDIGDMGKSDINVWLNDSDIIKLKTTCDKNGNLTIQHGYFSITRKN